MTDEVYTDCPACGEEIPFYRTVDGRHPDERFSEPPSNFEDKKRCPECGTPADVLFDIADGMADDDSTVVAADGGASADE